MDDLFNDDCMIELGNKRTHLLIRALHVSSNKITESEKEIIQVTIANNEKCFRLYPFQHGGYFGRVYLVFGNYYITENYHHTSNCGTSYNYEYTPHSIKTYNMFKILKISRISDSIEGIVAELEKQDSEDIKLFETIESVSDQLTKKEIECEKLYDEIDELKKQNAQYKINFTTFTSRIKELESVISLMKEPIKPKKV